MKNSDVARVARREIDSVKKSDDPWNGGAFSIGAIIMRTSMVKTCGGVMASAGVASAKEVESCADRLLQDLATIETNLALVKSRLYALDFMLAEIEGANL